MKTIFFSILFFSIALVYSQTGKVIKVKDGDTVVILDSLNVQHTIRVADIDCPERGQPFSSKAKEFVSNEIFGKQVTIKKKNTDRYGRIVGFVLYESKNLSLELLKNGLAWHYSYYSDSKEMAQLEVVARDNKIGLWIDPNPINPYNWRKGERN
jgi:micrococcal nuclease